MGFCTETAIKKIPAGGGLAQTIVTYMRPGSGAWGEDGYVYFTAIDGGTDGQMGLARVPDSGGEVEVLLRLDADAGESEAWLPEILPDGESVMVSVIGGGESGWRILTVGTDGRQKLVREGAFLGRFIPPNHLLYMDSDTQGVFGVAFDPGSATIEGSPLPLTEPIDLSFCYGVNASDLAYIAVPGAGEGSERPRTPAAAAPAPVRSASAIA